MVLHRRVALLVAGALLAGVFWMLPLGSSPVAAAAGKITICHRTHSTTNPYRRITVSQNAVQNGRHGGHGLPVGSLNPDVYDSTFVYAPNNKYWGDIIPGGDAAGLVYNGANPIALNWTIAGKADFAAYCAPMTPTEFYNSEIAAGQTSTDAIADLNDQAANEDAALLAALGGTFSAANISTWNTAVTVTTIAATQVTSTTATMNGSLTVGTTSTVPGFQYGTSSTLATSTSTSATPSPVTNTTSVNSALTGLAPATTYYFMVTGTTNAGTDTEGILIGTILSFTTAAAVVTTTTTTSTTTTSTTVPVTTTTSTTVPATTSLVADGSVRGVVWFDRNGDGVLDGNEWVLPGVTVVLDDTSTAPHVASLRTQAAATRLTAVTAADGTYFLGGLPIGSYRVTATATINGFDYTSDTDGALDWKVAVNVVAHTTSVADFAGLGRGEVTGQVFDSATLQGIAGASIRCQWSGFDDVLGNEDDVMFSITADPTGSFDMAGVPYGYFTC
ncbi:MAG: large repetitive protein, partial [Ilumatobacteraceae bacterium]